MRERTASFAMPPAVPPEDRSGEIGARLLKLLSVQAARSLRWVERRARQAGIEEEKFFVPYDPEKRWPLHDFYNVATNATLFATLARFGTPGESMGGVSREKMERMAGTMIRAVLETHPLSGSDLQRPEWWRKGMMGANARKNFIFGLGAWLLWNTLAADTREAIAGVFAHEADLLCDVDVPHLLYDDTQGESNAWTGSGLALAFCALKRHPRRERWGEKAREFMVTAYATQNDVGDSRVVDGKPLHRWLRGPNAFPDYTVENHGFIHPIYMATVSEMVRTAICYRLAEEPIPESATFNADHVLDMLLRLNLPDGNHLYVHGTDYDPRRIDSFLQACNVLPLKPNPLREACFRRALGNMETLARERPDLHMSGDLFFEFDFGSSWGLVENYLMRRLFGSPADAIPEEEIEGSLAGVHVNELGKFALRRTARAVSSFSWHAIARGSQVMGIAMPLDKDVLCFPATGSYIGHVTESLPAPPDSLEVLRHGVQAAEEGFGAILELQRCQGKVRQFCAFVSLPDGSSVYIERRVACQDVSIVSADSGNVRIYDDLRWPFQKRSRVFHYPDGIVEPAPEGQVCGGPWLNVDDRMGYVALGVEGFSLSRSTDLYRTWRLAFPWPASEADPLRVRSGEPVGCFALVSCPAQHAADTASLAAEILRRGWRVRDDSVLALDIGSCLVYANFSEASVPEPGNARGKRLPPWTAGYVPRSRRRAAPTV